jgi:hypothetical protein
VGQLHEVVGGDVAVQLNDFASDFLRLNFICGDLQMFQLRRLVSCLVSSPELGTL